MQNDANPSPSSSLQAVRSARADHAIVLPLATAEIVVWAAYYYAFPALLLIWEQDLGWSKAELSGAFTMALLISAVLAPIVGRLIDRGFAVQILVGSMALGGLLLVALSKITALWQFYLVWLGLGVAMAGSLYEACFAILTRMLGPDAKQGITKVALIAGFAGTVSFPSVHFLSVWFGWRGAVLVLAAAVILVAVPLAYTACRTANQRSRTSTAVMSRRLSEAVGAIRLGAFWCLALLFAVIAVNHGVLLTHLLPILNERGIDVEIAVFAAAMVGPMQVAGRVVMMLCGRHVSTLAIFVACLISTILAALALLAVGNSLAFLAGFVLLQGAGYGVTSIVRPVFIAERLGRENFGIVSGLLAIAFLGGMALSPTIAALIWGAGGYDHVIWFALGASIIGLMALAGARQ